MKNEPRKTSHEPDRPAAAARFSKLFVLLLGFGGMTLLAIVTLPQNSATRIMAWPWWGAWRILLAVPPLLLTQRMVTSRGEPLRCHPNMAWLTMAVAAVYFLSALLSEQPRTSLLAASTAFSAACLVIWLADRIGESEKAKARVATGVGAAGVVVTLVSLASWIGGNMLPGLRHTSELNAALGENVYSFHPLMFRNQAPLGHSNYTAGVALLVVPFLILLFARQRGSARVVWALATVAAVAMLVSASSRGSIIGLTGGGVFALAALARVRAWSTRRQITAAALGMVALAVIVVAIPRTREGLLSVLHGEELNLGDQQRVAMVEVGIRMGADHWWLGQGPGLVPDTYPDYRHGVEGGTDSVLQLHSVPVQLWADVGSLGLALGLALALTVIWRAWRKAEPDDPGWPASLAAGAALSGYGAFALTDYQLDVPIVAALLSACIALLASTDAATRHRLLKPAAGILGLVSAVTVISATAGEWAPRRVFAEAVTAFVNNADPDAFEEAVERVATLDPGNADYFAGAAAAHLRLMYADSNPLLRDQRAASARLLLDRTLELDPNHEFARFNLGWLMLGLDPHEAAVHFRHTLALAPDRRGVFLGLGLARLESGEAQDAIDALALELLTDPISITSPVWDSPLLAPHADAAVIRAIALAPELSHDGQLASTARLFAWWLGDSDAAPEFPPPLTGKITRETSGIAVLSRALGTPEDRRRLLARFLLIQTTRPAADDQLDVLERLLDTLGDDWLAWLQSPAGREPPFVRVFRNERPAHAMLAGNLDLPIPIDAYIVQENRLAVLFFRSLFPPRGLPHDPTVVSHVAAHDL